MKPLLHVMVSDASQVSLRKQVILSAGQGSQRHSLGGKPRPLSHKLTTRRPVLLATVDLAAATTPEAVHPGGGC